MIKRTVKPEKIAAVSNLKELLSKSKSVAVVDYTGLKVSQATQLRRDVTKSGGVMLVTKNTLFKIATGNSDLDLGGTNAFIFSLSDEVASVKAVAEFAKKNGVLTFKLGLLNGAVLSDSEIAKLATIPDKSTLIATAIGSLKSPLFGLANSLNWNLSQLVRTLAAVRAQKEVENFHV